MKFTDKKYLHLENTKKEKIHQINFDACQIGGEDDDISLFDNKLMQNEEEVKTINNELLERAEKILNEFGPEGAYKMAEFLRMISDKDIEQGIQL